MSAEHDRQFFDTFLIVLGALVAFTIAVYLLAQAIAGQTQERHIDENPLKAKMVAERISPVAAVAISGQPEPAARAVSMPATAARTVIAAIDKPDPAPTAAEVPVVAAAANGESIYNSACIACHMTGVAGAPKLGDSAAWAPRIAKGLDALYASSINGFQGEAGVMPPKGGRMDLDDAAIEAAVNYMVDAAK